MTYGKAREKFGQSAWWLHESEQVNVRSTAFVLIDVAAAITLNESLKPS
jgi:hypothetical protein